MKSIQKVVLVVIVIIVVVFLSTLALHSLIVSKPVQDTQHKDISIEQTENGWKFSKPSDQGVQFMYPDPLTTKFVTTQDWPPIVTMTSGEYVCVKGNTKDNTGVVTEHSVGNKKYCVTTSSEGAAGSTYTTYEYVRKQGDFLAHMTFTLRYVQCMNYDEPNQTACKTEQTGFDVDSLADRIVSSIRML
jgi:hypothetical protein